MEPRKRLFMQQASNWDCFSRQMLQFSYLFRQCNFQPFSNGATQTTNAKMQVSALSAKKKYTQRKHEKVNNLVIAKNRLTFVLRFFVK